jgi:hypothetical protein
VTLKPFKEDGLSHCKRIADGLRFKMDNSLGLDGAKKFEVFNIEFTTSKQQF